MTECYSKEISNALLAGLGTALMNRFTKTATDLVEPFFLTYHLF